jgi:hypothetical protein
MAKRCAKLGDDGENAPPTVQSPSFLSLTIKEP